MIQAAPCPCGGDAVWHKAGRAPEKVPEEAVCFLADDDFADDLCDGCFEQAVPPGEREAWKRIPQETARVD